MNGALVDSRGIVAAGDYASLAALALAGGGRWQAVREGSPLYRRMLADCRNEARECVRARIGRSARNIKGAANGE